MREIQMDPPSKREEVVRRLEFFGGGAELVAWVGWDRLMTHGRAGYTDGLHAFDFAADSARRLYAGWFEDDENRTPDPVISPNRQLFVYESGGDGGYVVFEEIADAPGESRSFPYLRSCSEWLGGLVFTPDGTELIAVRNLVPERTGEFVPEVVRFEVATLNKPPVRFEEKINPLTRQPYMAPVYDVKWRKGMTLPGPERIVTAALSADGRLLAAGDSQGTVHVAHLKRKKALASFPFPGRKPRDRCVVRVAFDPAAEWVVALANGRLFGYPLGAGKPWRTKNALGYAHDFAFHPSGRVLCAVFADGQARDFDAHTGVVRQSFKWAKKPKPLYSVAFAPDGLTCAVGGENGKVILWDVDV